MVHRVLGHDELRRRRVQAHRPVLLVRPVVGPVGGHEHPDLADREHRGGPHFALDAVPDPSRIAEAAVPEPCNRPVHRDRLAPLGIQPVTDRQRHLAVHSGLVAGLGRLRVDHRHEADALGVCLHQRPERRHAVAGRASAAAVGRLHQQHRSPFDGQSPRDRVGRCVNLRLKVETAGPVGFRSLSRQRRGLREVVVGHHDRPAAHPHLVQNRVNQKRARGQHAASSLERLGEPHHLRERTIALGRAQNRAGNDGDLPHGHRRPTEAVKRIQ